MAELTGNCARGQRSGDEAVQAILEHYRIEVHAEGEVAGALADGRVELGHFGPVRVCASCAGRMCSTDLNSGRTVWAALRRSLCGDEPEHSSGLPCQAWRGYWSARIRTPGPAMGWPRSLDARG